MTPLDAIAMVTALNQHLERLVAMKSDWCAPAIADARLMRQKLIDAMCEDIRKERAAAIGAAQQEQT